MELRDNRIAASFTGEEVIKIQQFADQYMMPISAAVRLLTLKALKQEDK